MNEMLNGVFTTLILFFIAIFLFKYCKNKKYNSRGFYQNTQIQKKEYFKIAIEKKGEALNAVMMLSNEKIFINGDITLRIPLEKIVSIQCPYALNTVTYQRDKIVRKVTNNFFIAPHKLMSTLIINFLNCKNEIVSLHVTLQQSKSNFRVNKISRIRFINKIMSVRKFFSKGNSKTGDGSMS